MSFVGIIANSKDYEFIKKELEKCSELQLININEKNVESMKSIKFETVVICNDLTGMKTKKQYLETIFKSAKYLIINSDIKIDGQIFENNETQIITYGMNQKATVTVSSVTEDSVLICLQRNIENVKSNIIEVQEFKIKSEHITNKKLYSLLVVFVLKKLYNPKI